MKLDYTSIKSVIVSSSADGVEIARIFSQAHQRSNAKEWVGDSRDRAFGYTEIGLALSDIVPGMLVIRALEQRKSRLDSLELPKISPVSNAGSEQKHKIKRKSVGTTAFHVAYTPIEYRLHGRSEMVLFLHPEWRDQCYHRHQLGLLAQYVPRGRAREESPHDRIPEKSEAAPLGLNFFSPPLLRGIIFFQTQRTSSPMR
jgi:hypothetical protein